MEIDKVREKLLDEFFKLDKKLQNKIIDNIQMIKAKLYLNLFECDKKDMEKSQFIFCLSVLLYNQSADDKIIKISKESIVLSTFHKLIADSSYLSSTIGFVLGRYNKEIEDIHDYIDDFIKFLKEYSPHIK